MHYDIIELSMQYTVFPQGGDVGLSLDICDIFPP